MTLGNQLETTASELKNERNALRHSNKMGAEQRRTAYETGQNYANEKADPANWPFRNGWLWQDFMDGYHSVPQDNETKKATFYDATGVFTEILDERIRQDAKWGGSEHDDQHKPSEWLRFIQDRSEEQRWAFHLPEQYLQGSPPYPRDYRSTLVKIAALAVAAIESFDRINPPRDPRLDQCAKCGFENCLCSKPSKGE